MRGLRGTVDEGRRDMIRRKGEHRRPARVRPRHTSLSRRKTFQTRKYLGTDHAAYRPCHVPPQALVVSADVLDDAENEYHDVKHDLAVRVLFLSREASSQDVSYPLSNFTFRWVPAVVRRHPTHPSSAPRKPSPKKTPLFLPACSVSKTTMKTLACVAP